MSGSGALFLPSKGVTTLNKPVVWGVLSVLALPPTIIHAAVYSQPTPAMETKLVTTVQYWPGWRRGPAWRGRPYWFARPWVRRPYYGTVVAGVALGALITVAAVGAVPPRPAPNLCWYWADPYRNRGYWDYCY